ncbi:MAG: CHAT domain-containing protein, partial [Bacteroidota bacterium]
MRSRLALTALHSSLSVALFIVFGCGKEPTPEEKHADSTLVLAKAQLDKGKYREGRHLLHSALALDLKLNRTQQLADEYSLLGRLSTLSADFDSAITYLNKAIEQYKSLTDRSNARALLLEIASLHRQMSEERVAYNMYTEALRLANVFHDAEGMRDIQFAMLPACRAVDDNELHAATINNLLKSYTDAGKQARAHYESALASLHRMEYTQAVEPLLRALTLAGQAHDSLFIINILSTLAATYDLTDNIQQAFETYTDALTRSDRTRGAQDLRLEMLMRVGNIYLRNIQPTDAAPFYRAALNSAIKMKNKLAEGYCFIQLGHCALSEGLTEDAVKSMQSALDLFTGLRYSPGIAYSNLSLGMAYQRAGRLNDAATFFKTALGHKEQEAAHPGHRDVYVECEYVTAHHKSYYDPLIELLLQLGRSDDAFWYAERKSEQTLFRDLISLEVRTQNVAVNMLFTALRHAHALHIGAERQLRKMLVHGPDDETLRESIVAQMKKANAAFQQSASNILRANPRWEPAVQFNGRTIAEVQRLLSPGTVIVKHIPTSRSLYVFAISNSRSTVQLAAVERKQLSALTTEFLGILRQQEALADSPAVLKKSLDLRVQELSTALYAALVRPVEADLAGASNVIIEPGRELVSVPVHALRKGGSWTTYCVEQFPISYVPSLSLLKNTNTPSPAVHDIVGLGHPGETGWDVEYELRDIRAFYKEARLFFGHLASLATLQREHADVLHLALDLHQQKGTPENAYVLLSDGKMPGTIKKILWGELFTIPPSPSVIVSHLHADRITADGLLPAVFLVNGSSSVIMNMLPVSRKAKKMFGELFYTALLAGKSTESALRQAQLEMIKSQDFNAPHMWA